MKSLKWTWKSTTVSNLSKECDDVTQQNIKRSMFECPEVSFEFEESVKEKKNGKRGTSQLEIVAQS